MLGVDDQHQEAEHDPDLQQDADGLEDLVRVLAERLQQPGHRLRRERLVTEREHPGVDLRAAVEQQRPDHVEDHEEHEPGGTGVGAVEPRPALAAGRRLPEPDHGERRQRHQHGAGEEVLEEAEQRPVPDDRDGEVAVEQRAVRLDDRGGQHHERPEGEEVRHPRHAPLQQLALAEDLAQLALEPGADVVEAAGCRLPGADQPGQVVDASAGDREGGHGDEQPEGEAHGTSCW